MRHLYKATLTILILSLAAATFILTAGTGTAAIPARQEPLPTPDPCASPTLRPTLNVINVRAGPGGTYDIIGTLSADDVRAIVGRDAYEPFWQIEVDDGGRGWVSDNIVQVDGHTGSVPVVEAPAIRGQTATPGVTEWNPTPTVDCLATYTPTPEPIALLATSTASPTSGQVPTNLSDDDGWQYPANLSRSGLATSPNLVVDEDGVMHVLWQEEGSAGFVYARGEDDSWSVPTILELPFATRAYYPDLDENSGPPLFRPIMLADEAGLIHAFWLDEEETLWHSRVQSAEFDAFSAWTGRQRVEDGVFRVTASIDDAELHVSYIRSVDADGRPAGVYYRRSEDSGESWSAATLLYQSRYFSSPVGREAQVQIAAAADRATSNVHLTWTDPALERLFLIRSGDGGDSWDPPSLVDQRRETDAADALRPSAPVLAVSGHNALLMWQAGHDNVQCSQYFQYSDDGGLTWAQSQSMLDELGQCPTSNQLLTLRDGETILFTVLGDQPYLLGWDGSRWSAAQRQEILASFEDRDIFRSVSLGCHSAALSGQQLIVTACQMAQVQDVWVTTRTLQATDTWFATQVWSDAAIVASGDAQVDFIRLYAGDGNERHAFWTWTDQPILYYALYSESRWSEAVAVLDLLGIVGQPAVVVDVSNDVVMVAWASEVGEISFRRSRLGQGFFAADWSDSRPVATGQAALGGLDIALQGSNVYIAYAISLNEERGIYLAQSDNQGNTWNSPAQIIDGAALDWPVVGLPQIAVTDNEVLHLFFSRDVWRPGSLHTVKYPYYARVQLADIRVVTPEPVAEDPVRWMQLLATGGDVLHRFWQQDVETSVGPSHQVSADGGEDWSDPVLISNWTGPAAVTPDGAGQLHLLQINDARVMEHRLWDGSRWSLEDGLLEAPRSTAADRIAALTTPEETLVVLWSELVTAGSMSDESTFELLASQRSIAAPSEAVSVSIAGGTSPTSAPSVTPTLTPTPTAAAPALPASSGAAQGPASEITQLILGFLPAGLFLAVTVVLIVGIRSLLPRLRR